MELRDIEYFAVVAEHGHLGRAADSLGLSQPALSKSLRRLEQAVEARLFKRTAKGVELTPEGSALQTRVRELRLSLQDVAREVKELGAGRVGHLRIGVGEAAGEHLMPAAISAMLHDAPRVTLLITTSDNDLMLPALRNGELDLVVNFLLPALAEGLSAEHLHDDEIIVCASANHRLALQKRVTLTDLVPERWASTEPGLLVQQWLRRAFEDRGLPAPRAALVSRSLRIRLQAVAGSDLLAFVSRRVFEHIAPPFRLAVLPVRELTWKRAVGVVHRKDAYLSPAARRLIGILRSADGHGPAQ